MTGILLARVEGLEAALTPRLVILFILRPSPSNPPEKNPQTPSRNPQKPSPQGPWEQSQWRTVEASDTALIWGGGRMLRDTLAAPRRRARGVMLVIVLSRIYTT